MLKAMPDNFAPAIPPAVQVRKLWESELQAEEPARRERARAELARLGA